METKTGLWIPEQPPRRAAPMPMRFAGPPVRSREALALEVLEREARDEKRRAKRKAARSARKRNR